MKKDFSQLEQWLASIETPFEKEMEDRIKMSCMEKIKAAPQEELLPSSFDKLCVFLRSTFQSSEPSAAQRARVKDRLFDKIEKVPVSIGLFNFFGRHRSLLGACFLMVFATTSLFVMDYSRLDAEKKTLLTNVMGEVYVVRDGAKIAAYLNMEIKENDKIMTGENSLATVEYFDRSVSRMSGETEVVIEKLVPPAEPEAADVVEVELKKGKVWNRVVKAVSDDSLFQVSAAGVMAKASDKAAFDITADDSGETLIKTVHNSIVVSDEDSAEDHKVDAGYQALVKEDDAAEEVVVTQVADIEEEKEWIVLNLDEDQEFIDEVEDKQDSVTEVFDDVQKLVAFDAVEREKLKLEIVDRRVRKAEALLNEGKTEEAEAIFNEFKEEVTEFNEFIEMLKVTDEKEAAELEEYLKTKIEGRINLVSSGDEASEGDSAEDSFDTEQILVDSLEGASQQIVAVEPELVTQEIVVASPVVAPVKKQPEASKELDAPEVERNEHGVHNFVENPSESEEQGVTKKPLPGLNLYFE